MLARLLREPLLHFVLLGAGAFAAYALLSERLDARSERTIYIDRQALVTFLRNRTQTLDDGAAAAAMDSLSPGARGALVDEFVRTEALYREARALGLDRGDYAIERRLVQQMEYLLSSVSDESVALDAGEIARYHAAHQERYCEPARVTFTHVFLRPREGESEVEGRARAAQLRDRLNGAHAAFHTAPAYGDRFLYQVNYVQRTAEEIAADFGPGTQAELFALRARPSTWQGPIRSSHGWHVVLLVEQSPQRDPPLDEIRGRVERDALRSRREAAVAAAIAEVVAGYTVRVDPALGAEH